MYRSLNRTTVRRVGVLCFLAMLVTAGCDQRSGIQESLAPSNAGEPPKAGGTATAPAQISSPLVTVRLSGAKSSDGEYVCALFSNSADFKARTNPIVSERIPVTDAATWTVAEIELESGICAVAVFHDENSNGKLDRHAFGYPLEAYGFSKNARGRLGPPSFEEAAFELTEEPVEMSIKLK